jgi:hypothetical protein
MVGGMDPLLETSKNPKNGEKKFLEKKNRKKKFFPPFFEFSRFPITGVNTRPCKYVTQEFFFLVLRPKGREPLSQTTTKQNNEQPKKKMPRSNSTAPSSKNKFSTKASKKASSRRKKEVKRIEAKPLPVMTPAARICLDAVLSKASGATFMEFVQSACADGSEGLTSLELCFQHPSVDVCEKITNLVCSDDYELEWMPSSFDCALNSVPKWSIASISGDIQPGVLIEGMANVNKVVAKVKLEGDSKFVFPYDEQLYGSLYATAISSGREDKQ